MKREKQHLQDGKVTVMTPGNVTEVEVIGGGLCISRQPGQGLSLRRRDGEFLAYVEIYEVRAGKSRVRIVAPPEIEIGRSVPHRKPSHAA